MRSDSERDLWSLVSDNKVFVNSTYCGFRFITITENAKWPTDSPDNCFCQMSWAFVMCSAGTDKVLAASENSSLSNSKTPLLLEQQTTTDNHVLNVNWMFFSFKKLTVCSPSASPPPSPSASQDARTAWSADPCMQVNRWKVPCNVSSILLWIYFKFVLHISMYQYVKYNCFGLQSINMSYLTINLI